GVPEEYKKKFWENVEAFKEAWMEELDVRNSIQKKELRLASVVEKIESNLDPHVKESVLSLYRELPVPRRIEEGKFRKSLLDKNTILITLRIDNEFGRIVGYAKGGPLENYKLRRGTNDQNMGKKNTAYLESISIKPGYWGGTGGHLLRLQFLSEARKRGFKYVTAYVHRNVIIHRINNGESIEIVQKYDPDRLDYYRQDLSKLKEDFLPSTMTANVSESNLE
ncbi:MAG: GNAT family N-acetyltransferase, partial [Nitrososphaerales archaeon]